MGPSQITALAEARALFAPLARQPHEMCGFCYLAADGTVLGLRHTPSSSFERIELPLRAVVRDALGLDAVDVVMAHNHPSGDPAPSEDDLAVTRRLERALNALGIRLIEHFVLAPERSVSLREAGLL